MMEKDFSHFEHADDLAEQNRNRTDRIINALNQRIAEVKLVIEYMENENFATLLHKAHQAKEHEDMAQMRSDNR